MKKVIINVAILAISIFGMLTGIFYTPWTGVFKWISPSLMLLSFTLFVGALYDLTDYLEEQEEEEL